MSPYQVNKRRGCELSKGPGRRNWKKKPRLHWLRLAYTPLRDFGEKLGHHFSAGHDVAVDILAKRPDLPSCRPGGEAPANEFPVGRARPRGLVMGVAGRETLRAA